MTQRRRLHGVAALVAVGAALLGCLAAAQPGEGAPQDQPEAQPATDPMDGLPAELRMVLENLDRANAELQDVTAVVTYERVIPLLDEKERSRGSLVFKKPDLIALELGRPRNEAAYSNGEKWWVVSHDEKQVEIYDAAAEGEEAGRETAFLDFGYGAGAEKLLADYEVELVETRPAEDEAGETVYRLKFTPRQAPDRPARYAAVEVEVSDVLWLPQVLVLHESGGEIVHTYTFGKVRLNTGVEDDVFEYEPPRGYTVLRPERF